SLSPPPLRGIADATSRTRRLDCPFDAGNAAGTATPAANVRSGGQGSRISAAPGHRLRAGAHTVERSCPGCGLEDWVLGPVRGLSVLPVQCYKRDLHFHTVESPKLRAPAMTDESEQTGFLRWWGRLPRRRLISGLLVGLGTDVLLLLTTDVHARLRFIAAWDVGASFALATLYF